MKSATDASDLRPCDCESGHEIRFMHWSTVDGRVLVYLVCFGCGQFTEMCETEAEARRLWNTRAGETERTT